MVTPIVVDGKHIGNIFIGQFIFDDEIPDVELFKKQARQYGFNESEYIDALERVPRLSRETVNTAMDFYSKLAEMISKLGYNVVKLSQAAVENKRIEESLRESEENLRVTLRSIGDGVIVTDVSGNVTQLNPIAERLTGWSVQDAVGLPLPKVFNIVNAYSRETVENPAEKVLATGVIVGLANHTVLIARNGKEYQIADSGSPIRNDSGEIIGVVLVFRDVTEEYEIQEQLRQSQKLDAVGLLAGGIAHDFNNVLSGIMGSAQLLQLPERLIDEKGKKYVNTILEASIRATDLIDKLLVFGRKADVSLDPVNLHKILEDTVSILYRTINKKIKISLKKNAGQCVVFGNHSALENVIINLGINASHAMKKGGVLLISTENIFIDQSYCDSSAFDLIAGNYCKICVTDSGEGIPADNMHKIFEPFFTTKEQGEGTGLGLTAVFGTIKEHSGEIRVHSEIGKGTTFQILLPCSDTGTDEPQKNQMYSGSGTILFVDDEEFNRSLGQDLLSSLGYDVILAENGQVSVDIFNLRHDEIDLVLMDMIMPEMNGTEAFLKMKEIDRNCKVIIASGFTKDNNIDELYKSGLAGFINKPYRVSELSRLIKGILSQ